MTLVTSLTAIIGIALYFSQDLPSAHSLKEVQYQVPLRVYSRQGTLIAEFGEKKRIPLDYSAFPAQMIYAILAAEDDRFFEHPGVDYQGILRAISQILLTGKKSQGGSTITMQVARNFFLSSEKTYTRKLREILLALKIEQELTKQEILALYLNKIYLGHRSYGVASAAQIYYGRPLAELTTAEFAMVAGLPKAPSAFNPIVNPSRAQTRRNYVLRRMLELGYIDANEFRQSLAAPITASLHTQAAELEAAYLAEMVRSEMVLKFGQDAYTAGYTVYTTIDDRLQIAANRALRTALTGYEHRHGYRGPEGQLAITHEATVEQWQSALASYSPYGDLLPAMVVAIGEQDITVYAQDGALRVIGWDGISWARRYLTDNKMGPELSSPSEILAFGDLIRIRQDESGQWALAQVPEVAGALVSLAPEDGRLLALTGGYDFYRSKFNRVTQALRQPGSNFKPFVYSAALEHGFTLASVINDAPVVFDDDNLESEWRPENYSGRFFGPTRLREALVRSRNLVSIRLLRATGITRALKHVAGFGFDTSKLPHDLSLALGSASMTPYDVVHGYAVLANGGYLVEPYFIERIEDVDGNTLFKAKPATVCEGCLEPGTDLPPPPLSADSALTEKPAEPPLEAPIQPNTVSIAENTVTPALRTIPARNVYLITSMMQDVIKRGTGRQALRLKRSDLAGKTGTTNEQRDAWFSGFNRDVVTTAWVGFDAPRPLGNSETGARAALPMWIDYMAVALDGLPDRPLEQPPGMVSVRIDALTGEYASTVTKDAIFELFRIEHAPQPPEHTTSGNGSTEGSAVENTLPEQLF